MAEPLSSTSSVFTPVKGTARLWEIDPRTNRIIGQPARLDALEPIGLAVSSEHRVDRRLQPRHRHSHPTGPMTVTLERAAVHMPDGGVIEEARGRQRRHAGVGAAASSADRGDRAGICVGRRERRRGEQAAPGSPSSAGRGLVGRSGGSGATQLMSIVGVSLAVPREWVGRTTTLSVGAGNAAWLAGHELPAARTGQRRSPHQSDATQRLGRDDLRVQRADSAKHAAQSRPAADARRAMWCRLRARPEGISCWNHRRSSAPEGSRSTPTSAPGVPHAVCCPW